MSYLPQIQNRISTTSFNSRDAATLAAGATFQGAGEDVSKYARAGVSITSDNATDGVLTIEVSRDGVTWGGPSRNWADTRFAQPHMWEIVEQYFRIKYVNGTTEATNLAIQVQYSVNGGVLLGHQLDETFIDETEGIATQSVLIGKTPSGIYSKVELGDSSELQVANYGIEVARGNLTGKTGVRVESRSAAVTTTERIISSTGATYNFLTSATTVRVKAGGNANDTAAGSGAREVTVVGLDDTGAVVSETIATNGATVSSATTATFMRINDFYVSQAGTYATGAIATGSNTGVISLETSGGTLLAGIPANLGRDGGAIYTVPTSKKGYFRRIRITPEGSKSVTFRVWTRKNFDDASAPLAPKLLRAEWVLINAEAGFTLDFPFALDSKEEVWVTAKTGSGTSAASVAFEIELIDN